MSDMTVLENHVINIIGCNCVARGFARASWSRLSTVKYPESGDRIVGIVRAKELEFVMSIWNRR